MQVGNIQLGIPVRMLRKNPMLGTEIGDMYIYDGLYDVVSSPCRLLHLRILHCGPASCIGTFF